MLIKTIFSRFISIMPRKSREVNCSKIDIIKLQQLSDDTKNPRMALRARIVLQCIDGKRIKDIASEFNERPNTVILWRDRFASNGIDGLYNLPRGTNANKYGKDLKQRILDKLNTDPPGEHRRWTGGMLASELGVPPDVVWRCLRKEKIRLSELMPADSCEDIRHSEVVTLDIPLTITARKETAMSTKKQNDNKGSGNMDLVITAKIIGKDGTVIEKEIRIDDALPDVRDFDLSTKEGFLRDFDQVERSMLSARGQLTEDITKEYLDTASKKNRSQKKQ